MTDEELLATLNARKQAREAKPEPTSNPAEDPILLELKARKAERAEQKRAQEEQDAPSTWDKVKHVAGGIPQAVADWVDTPHHLTQLVGDALEVPINWAAETGAEIIGGADRAEVVGDSVPTIPRLTNTPGIRQARDYLTTEQFEREDAPFADTLRTGAEWLGSPLKVARGLAKDPTAPWEAIKNGVTKADVTMPVGAIAGEAAVDAIGGENVYGEILGGLVGAAAGGKRATPKVVDNAAYEFIMENATNPEKALATLKANQAAGVKGTVAELTEDAGVMDVEVGAGTGEGGRQFKQEADAASQARQEQIVDDLRTELSTADAGDARTAANERVVDRTAAINQAETRGLDRARQAQEQQSAEIQRPVETAEAQVAATKAEDLAAADVAEEANQVVAADGKTVSSTGRDFAQTYGEAEQAFRDGKYADVRKAWQESGVHETRPMYMSGSDYLRELNADERALIDAEFSEVLEKARPSRSSAEAEVIGSYISRLKQAVEDSKNDFGKMSNEGRLLYGYVKALEEGMASAPEYAALKAAHSELITRFMPDRIATARKGAPEATMGALTGAAGGELGRLLKDAQVPELQGFVADRLMVYADSLPNGVDEAFLQKYTDVLNELPDELVKPFTDAADANVKKAATGTALTSALDNLDAAQKQAETGERALAQSVKKETDAVAGTAKSRQARLNAGEVAKYNKDPEAYLDSVLSGKADKTADLQKLNDYMIRAGKGEAFRADMADRLKAKLVKITTTNQDPRLTASAVSDFIKMRDRMLKAGVIDAKDAADLSEIMNRSRSLEVRKKAIGEQMLAGSNEYDNLLASMIAAAALTGMPGTQTLLVGGAVRRYVKLVLSKKGVKPKEVQALERLLIDPESFIGAAKNAKTANQAGQRIVDAAIASAQTSAGLNEEED